MALLRNTKEKNLRSVSFGQEQAERPHSVNREVNDLREDAELAFERLEGRDNLPEVHIGTISNDKDNNDVSCDLTGINFAAGRGIATATFDGRLILSAPGDAGNNVSAEIIAGAAEGVVVTDNHIAITTNDGVSTTNTLIAAIVGNVAANKIVVATAVTGKGGENPGAAAKANLAGGSGDGLVVTFYNATAGTSASTTDLSKVTLFTDTRLTVSELALVNAADNILAVAFESHTARSNVSTFTAV